MSGFGEYRAQARFVAGAGMCALTGSQTRRLARFGGSVCGATDLVLGCARPACLPFTPRTPPRWKLAPRGSSRAGKGPGDSFFLSGGMESMRKTRGWTPQFHVSPCRRKQNHSTGCLQNPRVVPFSPRIRSFCPRVVFCVFSIFSPPYLCISLISLKKERKRGGETGRVVIHGFFCCLFFHPRVRYEMNSYSVDENGYPWMGKSYKSTACIFFPVFPRSTGKNAYTPAKGGSQ